MSVRIRPLVSATSLTTAAATYYTAGSGVATQVYQATICNTDAANQTFSLHLVRQGGVANDTNVIYKEKSLAPNETFAMSALVNHILASGDFIAAQGSIAAKLTICVSGLERSQ